MCKGPGDNARPLPSIYGGSADEPFPGLTAYDE